MQPPPAGHTHVLIQREALGTLTQMKRTVPALRAKAHQLRIAALRTAPHLHSAEDRSRSNCADRDNNGRHASNAFNGCSFPSVRNHYILPTIQDEGVNKRAISMPRANNGSILDPLLDDQVLRQLGLCITVEDECPLSSALDRCFLPLADSPMRLRGADVHLNELLLPAGNSWRRYLKLNGPPKSLMSR
jgi:hypothetical protein